jgi:hypothetical protein
MIKIELPYGEFAISYAKITGDNPIFKGLFDTIDMDEIEPSDGDVDLYLGRTMMGMLPGAKVSELVLAPIDNAVEY